MGVIRECGGKMHMAQREFEKARNDFFEAFKNYDEVHEQQQPPTALTAHTFYLHTPSLTS